MLATKMNFEMVLYDKKKVHFENNLCATLIKCSVHAKTLLILYTSC